MNECVLPCGMKRIISSLVNGQNIDHTEGIQKSFFFFNILDISAKMPVNWNIFIYQGNRSRIATRSHSWKQLWPQGSHVRRSPQLLSKAGLRGLAACSHLRTTGSGSERHGVRGIGKWTCQEILVLFLVLLLVSFLKWNSMEYRHMGIL